VKRKRWRGRGGGGRSGGETTRVKMRDVGERRRKGWRGE